MEELSRRVIAGAVAGVGATVLMSAVMLASRRAGLTPQLPPDRIAEEGIEQLAERPSREDEEAVVATAAHFAFGAGAGAVYGAATTPIRPLPMPAMLAAGLIFGTAVWLVSYQGWVPALRIMPPASRDHPGRVATMVVAHWVYGAALATATRRLADGARA